MSALNTYDIELIGQVLHKMMKLRELDKDLIEIQAELDSVLALLSENPAQNPRDYRLKDKADWEERKRETEKEIIECEKIIEGNLAAI